MGKEQEDKKLDYYERHKQKQKKRTVRVRLEIGAIIIAVASFCLWGLPRILPKKDKEVASLQKPAAGHTENEKSENAVPSPEIDMQLLTVNDFSRPGEYTDGIEKIVVHYLGNPGTTAQENRDYFESLKDLQDVSMSANFVIGLEGEIIECVPPGEIAYASNSMNHLSISIENCHPDTTGVFTEATYQSCVHLVAYLVEEYNLSREDIIRHYDVTGKECPIYYVRNEDKWEEFRDDVMAYIKEWNG